MEVKTSLKEKQHNKFSKFFLLQQGNANFVIIFKILQIKFHMKLKNIFSEFCFKF